MFDELCVIYQFLLIKTQIMVDFDKIMIYENLILIIQAITFMNSIIN